MDTDHLLAHAIADTAHLLRGAASDLDPLLELVGDAGVVLVGEATHGTHEFYQLRTTLTKRLIEEKGFAAVAIEGDWPDTYRLNRYVRGMGDDGDAVEALASFRRFPAWMWRNADVLDFVGWLREHDDALPAAEKVGLYGLDLYSLHASAAAVLAHLDRVDPGAAQRARERYGCFDRFDADPRRYGYTTSLGLQADCEDEVVAQLVDLLQRRTELLHEQGLAEADAQFEAEQNARVVKTAEEYYRTMFEGQIASWNLRDTHMADVLDALLAHLARRVPRPKVIVWAHNSHVGDARATAMGDEGELNLGQLARERHGRDALLVGQTTYEGTVTAAASWDGPAERRHLRAALPHSYEALLHQTGLPRFILPLHDLGEAAGGLREPRLSRAVGVLYRPELERASHYFEARLVRQFDALVHLDRTRALEPLERSASWERGELPETYPTGD